MGNRIISKLKDPVKKLLGGYRIFDEAGLIYTADMGFYWWEKENDIWVNNNKKIEPEYYQGVFIK